MATIIQICDLAGHSLSIQKFEQIDIRIGRAWDNDLVIPEPHICACHLLIRRTTKGGWEIEDLNSLNGTFLKGNKIHQGQLASGQEVRIGNRLLRVFHPEHPVKTSKPLYTGYLPYQNWGNIATAICSLLILLGLELLDAYQSLSYKVNWPRLISEHINILYMPLIWSIFWATIGKIVVHQARFLLHFSVGATLFSGLMLTVFAGEYIDFIFSSPVAGQLVDWLGGLLLLAIAIYCAATVATHYRRHTRALGAAMLGGAIILLMLAMEYAEQPDFNQSPEYSATLKPLDISPNKQLSFAEHQENNQALTEELLLEAAKNSESQEQTK